jgi:TAZ zinc finger
MLEVLLYRDAPSLEAYKSISTLSHRLKRIAIEVRKKRSRNSTTSQGVGGDGPAGGRRDHETTDAVRTRHQQQRLLLLHHAAKCPYKDGTCPITQHCGDMKRLWRHMEGCTDIHCTVAHCWSSRGILSHYRTCKDQDCLPCGSVRKIIKKSKSQGSHGQENVETKNS